ncbi:MAG TPA: choice-of-anchor R domain-containing protein [Terriglobales bacterium]
MKKGIAISCLALLACATMLLASPKHSNVTFSPDYKRVIATGSSTHIIPNVEPPSDKKVISGNLSSYPNGTYFCCFGYTIAGTGEGFPFEVWEAIAFTPASNATVTGIKAAIGTFGGTAGFQLGLYTDDGGVPGTALKSFHISNPPTYGTCCVVDSGRDGNGIPVTGGTQYWLVAKVGPNDNDFEGGWNMNVTDQRVGEYTVASYCLGSSTYCGSNSGKWTAGTNGDPGNAYAVVGTE